jgi:ribosomal protein S18 acetylase RimI-like enzyme
VGSASRLSWNRRRGEDEIEWSITLRPIEADDEAFLYRVYAATRAAELAQVEWDAAQREAFLRQQFTAQHRYYQEHYADTAFQVVLVDGRPAGRLYVARWPEEVRIVDIALLPEHRHAGIGTALLRELQAEAARAGKPLRIHVEVFNPARRLYERLGFRTIADRGVYLFLEWSPGGEQRAT